MSADDLLVQVEDVPTVGGVGVVGDSVGGLTQQGRGARAGNQTEAVIAHHLLRDLLHLLGIVVPEMDASREA